MTFYRSTMRFMWQDSYKALRAFLAVLLLVDAALFVLQRGSIPFTNNSQQWIRISTSSSHFFSANYGAIAVFILVSGLLAATVTFPLMLSLSSTRRNYLRGVLSYGVISSAGLALFQALVAHGGMVILKWSGMPSENGPGSFLTLLYIQFVIYLLIFLLFTLLGMVFYRFGTLSGLIMIAVYILILYYTTNDTELTFQVTHYLLGLCPIIAALLWLIVRKATVKTY